MTIRASHRAAGIFVGLVALWGVTDGASGQTRDAGRAPAIARIDGPLRTVYIVPTSHYDLGFVEPPSAVMARAARHIDEVLRLAEEDPRFRWTIESVWQLEEWLARAKAPTSVLPPDAARIERLMRLIREGRIAVSAAWGSMHTDFMGTEELNRLVYGFADLRRRHRIDTTFAMLDDVPGHPASLPSVLEQSGVTRLVVGVNQGLMGGTTLAPGRVPFYWEGPDGRSVLTWISQGVRGGYVEALTDFYLNPFSLDPYTGLTPYRMFNPQAGDRTPLAIMEEGVRALQKRYGDAGYELDAALVLHAHDFLEPGSAVDLQRAVDLWNAHYVSPTLKVATPPEFFDDVERRYGATLPRYRGEWSGLWSEAKSHSPRISALARQAHDLVPAAETLWAAAAAREGIPPPTGTVTRLYRQTMVYDEHSGAGNTGWPKLNSRIGLLDQNREYAESMTQTVAEATTLLDAGVALLTEPAEIAAAQPAGRRTLVVYNPLSWARTDVVRLAALDGRQITGIADRHGNAVPFDIDIDGSLVFIASGVPPVGYASFAIDTQEGTAPSTLRSEPGATVQFDGMTMTADAGGRLTGLRTGGLATEWVASHRGLAFNELVRTRGDQRIAVADPFPAVLTVERGRIMARLTARREGSVQPLTAYTVYRGLGRLDWRNEIDGRRLPFVRARRTWHESYYFAFPLTFDPAALTLQAEGQRGWTALPGGWLPGARRDAVTTQHAVAFTERDRHLVVAHRQSFHFTFGDFLRLDTTPPPATDLPAMMSGRWPLADATLFARAFRRGTQSDTSDLGVIHLETVEPGLGHRYVFEYALATGDTFDPVRATRLGWALNVPLRAQLLPAPPRDAEASLLAIDAPNVVLLTFKATEADPVEGHVTASPLIPTIPSRFTVRLQEVAGTATTARVRLPAPAVRADRRDLLEERVVEVLTPGREIAVTLAPFEVVTVVIEVAAPAGGAVK